MKQGNIHGILSKLIVAISIKQRACTRSVYEKIINADTVNNLQEKSKYNWFYIRNLKKQFFIYLSNWSIFRAMTSKTFLLAVYRTFCFQLLPILVSLAVLLPLVAFSFT